MEEILIMPTMKCPVGCRFCGNGPEVRKLPDMEDSVLERLLNEAKKEDIGEVHITGGEVITEQYKDKLIRALHKTKVGKGRDLLVATSGYWATSYKLARETLKELKSAHVSELSLSTDSFHVEHIPLENLANILKALDKVDIGLNSIRVFSLKSTVEKDAMLIKKLGELIGKPISKTSLFYRTRSSMNSYNGFKNPVEFGGLKNVSVLYSLGKDSSYDFIVGPIGINADQNAATWDGIAKKFVNSKDVFRRSHRKALLYDRRELIQPLVIADGSVLHDCAFNLINDWKRARLGVYPKASLKEIERRSQSFSFNSRMVYADIMTYLIGIEAFDLMEKRCCAIRNRFLKGSYSKPVNETSN